MKNGLFLLCFLMLLKPVLPVVEYAVNYEYISKVLCVNKAKPAMHCNGKCHLIKELAKASENEKPISSDKKSSVQEHEVLFYQEIEAFVLSDWSNGHSSVDTIYFNLYSHCGAYAVFHPPTFLS